MEKKLQIHVCAEIRYKRRCEARAYAHVFHYSHAICIAPELLTLPPRFLFAILLHELGHLGLAEPHTERDADAAGGALAGVAIGRADHGPARNLEVLRSQDIPRARTVIRRLVSLPADL